MLIEALTPLKVRVDDRELLLDPGQPQELSDEDARRLLAKVPDKVRIVTPDPYPDEEVVVEPAVRPDGSPLTPVYWEAVSGRLYGPAVPVYVAKTKAAAAVEFWVCVEYQGRIVWVHESRLRSGRR